MDGVLPGGSGSVGFRNNIWTIPRYHALIDKLEEVSGWKSRRRNQEWW